MATVDARTAFIAEEVRNSVKSLCELVGLEVPDSQVEVSFMGERKSDVNCVVLAGTFEEINRTEKYMAAGVWLHQQLNPEFYSKQSVTTYKNIQVIFAVAYLAYYILQYEQERTTESSHNLFLDNLALLTNKYLAVPVFTEDKEPIEETFVQGINGYLFRAAASMAAGIYQNGLVNGSWKKSFNALLQMDAEEAQTFLAQFSSMDFL